MNKKKDIYMFETGYYKIVYVAAIIFIALTIITSIVFKNYYVLCIFVILSLVLFSTLSNMFKKDINNNNIKKRLLKSGIEYEGTIIGYKKHGLLKTMTGVQIEQAQSVDSDIYTLVIEYNGIQFETPPIIYNPNKLFAAKTCKVYANEDSAYATDFVMTDKNFCELTCLTEKE